MRFIVPVLLAVVFLGCKSASDTDSGTEAVPVEIFRLDKQLMAFNDKNKLQDFLLQNPTYVRSFYRAYAEDTAFVNHLFYIYNHPETRKFQEETAAFYGDLKDLEAEFGMAFARIKQQFPDFTPPKVVATFTGLENDIYVSDSVVYIALEAFVGPSATYRPDQPTYILNRYQKPYIVPTVVRFIADKYNRSNETDNSLLGDMLYFGKAFEFAKAMLPQGSDSLIIAYPDSTMRQVHNNQDLVWAHFLDEQLLYEQNTRIKERYIGERPKVPEIGPLCPGRIGQWLGWRIIQAYRKENPDVALKDLMANTNNQEVFKASNYRGKADEE